jgi:integrase
LWNEWSILRYGGGMPRAGTGHIERLPSGSYRVHVYAGTDPLTGRELRHRQTVKTQQQAQIVLGRLLEQAAEGWRPDSDVTVADVLARYMAIVELDPSTRETYEGYIRRTIMPALGAMELRKIRGPVLDSFYARLRLCADLACTGRPFIEHSFFPSLVIDLGNKRPAWQQAADIIRAAIRSGRLAPGEQLPSVRELAAHYDLSMATAQRAMEALASEQIIGVRQGRRAIISGAPGQVSARRSRPDDASHDCARAGCQPHQCRPMSPRTIRQIHSILSGAFAAAVRWEWINRNPASSAKLPKTRHRSPTSPTPTDVAAVIAAAKDQELDLVALYMWLAAVTGARRGELCGLQWGDIDLDAGLVHIAFSYLVRGGQKIRKDTKTHQDRYIAIDAVTAAVLAERKQQVQALLATTDVKLAPTAYVFAGDLLGLTPWNPDWVTHKVAEVAEGAGVSLNIKALRHYTASQLLAGGIDLRNTAARLGHGGGGATTLRHYADPVSEVDRRAAAYLAQLTAPKASDKAVRQAYEKSAETRTP